MGTDVDAWLASVALSDIKVLHMAFSRSASVMQTSLVQVQSSLCLNATVAQPFKHKCLIYSAEKAEKLLRIVDILGQPVQLSSAMLSADADNSYKLWTLSVQSCHACNVKSEVIQVFCFTPTLPSSMSENF